MVNQTSLGVLDQAKVGTDPRKNIKHMDFIRENGYLAMTETQEWVILWCCLFCEIFTVTEVQADVIPSTQTTTSNHHLVEDVEDDSKKRGNYHRLSWFFTKKS